MTIGQRALWVGLAVVSWVSASQAQPLGLEELWRLDRLPAFKTSTSIGSISSYDRTGGNDDGFSGKFSSVRQDPEGVVLADLKGPGIIYRLWTPTPTDDVMEFLFDGETKPRVEVKFRELFLGSHPLFPRPLVGFGVGGYFSYVPIPFARSCVVRVRAKRVQFYQINYALFAPETPLTSFGPEPAATELAERQKVIEVWNQSGGDLSRFTAPPGAKVEVAQRSFTLVPKSSETLFRSDAGGRIVGLRVMPTSALIGKGRDLILRISFDGEEPAVLCPLGDFFGYGWGRPATQSLLVGTSGETNYCYFPMPYNRSARVEILSERSTAVELRTEVLHALKPRQESEGKFYALWRRENPTTLGEPFRFIETKGRGHLVGVVLQSQGFESGKTLFFEGDDQTTIDGHLAIHGTGSEDFFNGGWYDVPDRWEKQLSFPLSGCLGYAKHLGRTGAYRLFVGDAYAYHQSLRQTIEHSGEKNNILTDYCGVTYLYSEQRPTEPIELPPLAARTVNDLQEIIFPAWWQLPISAWSFGNASLTRKKVKVGTDEVQSLSLRGEGQDWFGPHFLSPSCDLPAGGRYAIYIEAVKGPDQARVQLFQNENPVSAPVDLYAERAAKSERLLLGRLELAEGKNNLMFKLVDKNEKSSGWGFDLITVICVREP